MDSVGHSQVGETFKVPSGWRSVTVDGYVDKSKNDDKIVLDAFGDGKNYFNTGDLVICANVLESYLNNSPAGVVPWDDLRYIFGEIMYGGHIVDDWDRRLCNSYLEYIMEPGLCID